MTTSLRFHCALILRKCIFNPYKRITNIEKIKSITHVLPCIWANYNQNEMDFFVPQLWLSPYSFHSTPILIFKPFPIQVNWAEVFMWQLWLSLLTAENWISTFAKTFPNLAHAKSPYQRHIRNSSRTGFWMSLTCLIFVNFGTPLHY